MTVREFQCMTHEPHAKAQHGLHDHLGINSLPHAFLLSIGKRLFSIVRLCHVQWQIHCGGSRCNTSKLHHTKYAAIATPNAIFAS